MILSAQSIRRRCVGGGMIRPYSPRTVSHGKSFGLSAAGYDVRVEFGEGRMHGQDGVVTRVRMNTTRKFMLASTMEHFTMPSNVMGVVHDKSSWARKGLTVQNTVIEPGWRGYLTLELIYHGDNGLVIYAGDPIAQIVFHLLDEHTDQPYTGKYQDQKAGPQKARDEYPEPHPKRIMSPAESRAWLEGEWR